MTDWNNSCNYKYNYNKPNISHSKTYKGKYKTICDGCLNPSNDKQKTIKHQLCEKPICPDIIEIYNKSECVYKPNFKNSIKKDMKKIFKKDNDTELHKPKLINCKKKKIKINMNDYHTDNENVNENDRELHKPKIINCKKEKIKINMNHYHTDNDKDKINEFISLLTEKISYNI